MSPIENANEAMAAAYEEEAEACGWFGPEVVFGLAYRYLRPGQSVLDVGIGTGLSAALFRKAGLDVHGMDISRKMLAVCRSKGFAGLRRHDLNRPPYPYDSGSMDHIVCAGVMNFFSDLSPVFHEAGRILRSEGLFSFVVVDRVESEVHAIKVVPEHAQSEDAVMMYRHSPRQIDAWLEEFDFELVRNLAFTVFMDPGRTRRMPVRAYLGRQRGGQ